MFSRARSAREQELRSYGLEEAENRSERGDRNASLGVLLREDALVLLGCLEDSIKLLGNSSLSHLPLLIELCFDQLFEHAYLDPSCAALLLDQCPAFFAI